MSLLVIHSISLPPGEYGGPHIDALFTNSLDGSVHPYFQALAGLEVSAHLLIRRSGEPVQYVSFEARAWHAGVSSFEGRSGCNDFSIGIELEGTDVGEFTDAQYQTLVGITRELMRCYPGITSRRIVGHSDIAPGRKTDPGTGFDWSRFRQAIGGTE